MFDFVLQKIMPAVLLFFGIASIDTPGNYVRKVFLEVCNRLQWALESLPIDIF